MRFVFFKQRTAYDVRISDWSSDVCSSDLNPVVALREIAEQTIRPKDLQETLVGSMQKVVIDDDDTPDEISSISRSAEALRLTAAAPPRSPAGGGSDFEIGRAHV